MTKCVCNDKKCLISMLVDQDGIHFVSKSGEVTLMYIDANTIIELIKQLRKALFDMTTNNF